MSYSRPSQHQRWHSVFQFICSAFDRLPSGEIMYSHVCNCAKDFTASAGLSQQIYNLCKTTHWTFLLGRPIANPKLNRLSRRYSENPLFPLDSLTITELCNCLSLSIPTGHQTPSPSKSPRFIFINDAPLPGPASCHFSPDLLTLRTQDGSGLRNASPCLRSRLHPLSQRNLLKF